MNIIEDENKTSDTNQAVCSVTEGHQLYPLIVTFRCQANTQRIEVNLRSGILSEVKNCKFHRIEPSHNLGQHRAFSILYRPIEGFSGELLVYVFPNVQGNKIATRKIFDVKALSLYSRSATGRFSDYLKMSKQRYII